jgi:hypothetical protein
MTGWSDLTTELDAWQASGKAAEFWWRDDDAVAVTPALERLITLQRKHSAPLMLAVIPARAMPDLAVRLKGEDGIVPVQHGWAHLNHAGVGHSKAELGPHRPTGLVLGELVRGAFTMDRLFGSWLRVLVPPHNRIAPAVAAGLAAAGYVGLSTDRPRKTPPPGLIQVNTHIDIMDWSTRAFLGEAACLDLAINHLAAKRAGRVDPSEPTGLLTHHLAHDEPAWAFTDRFIGHLRGHPAIRWVDPRQLFRASGLKGAA